MVLASARLYSTPTKWRTAEGGARAAAITKSWYAEATAHMTRTVGSKSHKWTKEAVLADAKLYKSRAEWRKSSRAYPMAHRQGWLEEACAHMGALWQAKWDKAAVLADALKFASRSVWENSSSGAYASGVRNGWYNEATAHMPMLIQSWTKESVLADARRFKTRGEWFKESSSYYIAHLNDWQDEASSHMPKIFSLGELVIYSYLTERDVVFVHQKTFEDLRNINKLPFDFHLPLFNLVVEYHGIQHQRGWGGKVEDAREIQRRDYIKHQYAAAKGIRYLAINALNRVQTEVELESTLVSIAQADGIAFNPSHKRELTSDERRVMTSLGRLSKEDVLASAMQYSSITDWKKGSSGAYSRSLKMGWKDEAVMHMKRRINPSGYWTKDRVIESARPFKTQVAWKNSFGGSWSKAVKMNWVQEATAHMKQVL